jgi:hypothetical protein
MDTESCVRSVIGTAHEIRVRFRDSRVIFASVVPAGDTREGCFVVRPWGLRSTMVFRFDDVSRARPVRHMDWEQQRRICATQVAEWTP